LRAFEAAVKETYNLKPSKLNEKQQAVKAKEMDRFWKMVKADADHLLPCLRAALEDPKSESSLRVGWVAALGLTVSSALRRTRSAASRQGA
jgi:hypothetical protein